MVTLADIRVACQDDLTVGDESTLYSPNLIDRAINRAYRKAGGLLPWPELQDAKKTVTQANQEYYDYPQNWRSNSIWKLSITNSDAEEERYGEDPDGSPLSFDDYLNWKEDNPDSTDKKWANQWRRFFIWPVPTTLGSLATGIGVICIWGIKVVTAMSADSDTTVFSYSTPEANEAIQLEAVAILKAKTDEDKSAQFRSAEAKQILAVAWGKIAREQAKFEKLQPMFEVSDMFGGSNSKDLRGRFDI
ncbi:MAG: hypothetical protein NUV69_00470 [Candidatus Curtissbacteria bacterium]|nr:hypothetical protein [Candidatus Curtissbacteria bacterium]